MAMPPGSGGGLRSPGRSSTGASTTTFAMRTRRSGLRRDWQSPSAASLAVAASAPARRRSLNGLERPPAGCERPGKAILRNRATAGKRSVVSGRPGIAAAGPERCAAPPRLAGGGGAWRIVPVPMSERHGHVDLEAELARRLANGQLKEAASLAIESYGPEVLNF